MLCERELCSWSVRLMRGVSSSSEGGSLSWSWIPPPARPSLLSSLEGVRTGGVRKRLTKGAVLGREEVRTRMSVRRLEDS